MFGFVQPNTKDITDEEKARYTTVSYTHLDNYGGMIKTAVITGDMSTVTMDVRSRSGTGYIGALVGTSGQRCV